MASKTYSGSVYTGVVGPENEPGECRDSIHKLLLRPGDSPPQFVRATKGYEARQLHINNFIDETKHDFISLLDHDMIHPADTLERLRSHGLPYVSGLYMRRSYRPIQPIWFRPFTGKWPMEPWHGPIETDKLHKIGGSGWGCILLHREVILSVRALLKGEWDVLEDDMDIYPYNLQRIAEAIRGLRDLVSERPSQSTLFPALEHHTQTLEDEIRPLRVDKSNIIGSDIRYPFFALQAGYQLFGDPNVRCGHMLNYPLSCDDYDGQISEPETLDSLVKGTKRRMRDDRRKMKARRLEVWGE